MPGEITAHREPSTTGAASTGSPGWRIEFQVWSISHFCGQIPSNVVHVSTMRNKNPCGTLASSVLAFVAIGAAAPRTEGVQNAMEGDPKALEQGMHMYRHRCGVCHGLDGLGYRGPDLKNGPWLHGDSDADLFRVISQGVPGSEMGPARLTEDEVWMVIAYLRSLRSSGTDRQEPGDAAAGEEIYWGKGLCDQCHRIQGRGGRLGPDLSNIGRARSRSALTRELRNASEYFPPGYEPVTVVLRDGRRIPGVRKNEDTFRFNGWMRTRSFAFSSRVTWQRSSTKSVRSCRTTVPRSSRTPSSTIS